MTIFVSLLMFLFLFFNQLFKLGTFYPFLSYSVNLKMVMAAFVYEKGPIDIDKLN